MLGSGEDGRGKRKELKIMEPFPLISFIYLTVFWVFTVYESLSNVPWGVKRGADGERESTILCGGMIHAEGGHGSGSVGSLCKESRMRADVSLPPFNLTSLYAAHQSWIV